MKKNRQDPTYQDVERRFDSYEANRPPPERRRYVAGRPFVTEGVLCAIFTAVGVGTGLLLLGLAAVSFYAASTWEGIARNGAAVGYNVTGFFLTIAGLGAIVATWNHNYRVPDRPPAHH